jgi:hypothetical protein
MPQSVGWQFIGHIVRITALIQFLRPASIDGARLVAIVMLASQWFEPLDNSGIDARLVRLGLLGGSLLLLSGCVSLLYLPTIGTRTEQVAVYERAVSNGNEFIVYYQTDTHAGNYRVTGRRVAAGAARWSRIDLRTVSWIALAELTSSSPRTAVTLTIEDGPRPALAAGFEEVAIVTIPTDKVPRDPELLSYLVSATAPHAFSFVQFDEGRGHRNALLVRRDSRDVLMCNNRVSPPHRDYDAWWAIPARIVLAPFAVAADVLLSPFYLGCVLGIFACHG